MQGVIIDAIEAQIEQYDRMSHEDERQEFKLKGKVTSKPSKIERSRANALLAGNAKLR